MFSEASSNGQKMEERVKVDFEGRLARNIFLNDCKSFNNYLKWRLIKAMRLLGEIEDNGICRALHEYLLPVFTETLSMWH